MLLTTTPFEGLKELLPVILWILLPLSAFSLVVIVLLHYGRRTGKNRTRDAEEYETIANSAPENFCYRAEDGTLVYLDHTGLLKDYRKRLAYSHARYAAVKQDLTRLRLLMDGSGRREPEEHFKQNPIRMEYNNTTVLPQQETSGEKETAYLNDLLTERDKQIAFLQNQIDLRVKSQHFSTREKEELEQKLKRSEQIAQELDGELASLRNNLSGQQEEMKRLQALADEGGQELAEARQALESRQKQIIYMENVLHELKEQNQLLHAAAADQTDRNNALEEQLQVREDRLQSAQQRIVAQKQLLQRLYNEMAICLKEETDTPPVVALRPGYINPEWEESAAH